MGKLSLISILACTCFIGCGTREKDSKQAHDNGGNCSVTFVQDYEKTQGLMNKAYELGIGDAKPENQENEQAAQQACEAFKTTYQEMACKAQDGNGADVDMKASDVNEECDYFIKSRKADLPASVEAAAEAPPGTAN